MIIGFTGEMGSGKSTAIDMLRDIATPNTVRAVKFAAPLYAAQEYLYTLISSVYERPASFVKDRRLLQWLGTDWGRETVSETLWVDLWKKKARELSFEYPKSVIVSDDVRFNDEAQAVKSLGGYVIRIFSSSNQNRIDTNTGFVHHRSEAGIDHKLVDYWIDNSGTLENLKNQVQSLWLELTERNESNGL